MVLLNYLGKPQIPKTCSPVLFCAPFPFFHDPPFILHTNFLFKRRSRLLKFDDFPQPQLIKYTRVCIGWIGEKMFSGTFWKIDIFFWNLATFPKIYLGKFSKKSLSKILVTWLIMTSSFTWPKFLKSQKKIWIWAWYTVRKRNLVAF